MLIDTTWRRVTLRALSNSLRMTRRADPSSREEQEVALLRWAEQRGAWISDKIELRQTDYGGRSFFALSRIEEGEVREKESNSAREGEAVHSTMRAKSDRGKGLTKTETGCYAATNVKGLRSH
jgi:hypothetical protein